MALSFARYAAQCGSRSFHRLQICFIASHSAKAPDETGVHVAQNRIARLRDAAFAQQGGRCWYCGYRMVPASTIGTPKGRFACTAEHLVPNSEGGTDTGDNIKSACLFCNQTRHKMRIVLTPEAYRQHVRKRLAKGKWHPGVAQA